MIAAIHVIAVAEDEIEVDQEIEREIGRQIVDLVATTDTTLPETIENLVDRLHVIVTGILHCEIVVFGCSIHLN